MPGRKGPVAGHALRNGFSHGLDGFRLHQAMRGLLPGKPGLRIIILSVGRLLMIKQLLEYPEIGEKLIRSSNEFILNRFWRRRQGRQAKPRQSSRIAIVRHGMKAAYFLPG
jgi:hypothetical protein